MYLTLRHFLKAHVLKELQPYTSLFSQIDCPSARTYFRCHLDLVEVLVQRQFLAAHNFTPPHTGSA